MKKRLAAILILTLTISLVPVFAYGEGKSSPSSDSALKTEAENSENQTVEDSTPEEETDKDAVPDGWVKKNGKKRYYYKKGKKVTGWKTIDGKRYYFNKYGVMQTGVKKIDGKVYYLRNGVKTVREGWHTIKGARYYGYSNGTFANKVKKIKNHVYLFRSNGQLITKKGLFKYKGKWYYGAGKGRLKTGWVAKDKKAMYFNKKTCKTGTIGSMARNTTVGYLKIPKSGKLGEAYALGVKQLDKSGWSLMNAYTFSYRLRYGDRWYRRKTSEEYALRGFKYGYGNCYVMAATFYIQAKLLGYDVHQVAGKVDLPHSWTVIYEDGKQWVYDPNFRNETGRNGYKIYYGKKGTWRYNSYYQMN